MQNGKLKDNFYEDEELFTAVNAALEFFTSVCYVHITKMLKTRDYLYYSAEMQYLYNDVAIKNYLNILLDKSIITYLICNRIKNKEKFNYVGEFLPFLSLQLYAYMGKYRCTLKDAQSYFKKIVIDKYELQEKGL